MRSNDLDIKDEFVAPAKSSAEEDTTKTVLVHGQEESWQIRVFLPFVLQGFKDLEVFYEDLSTKC